VPGWIELKHEEHKGHKEEKRFTAKGAELAEGRGELRFQI
jgi:hypothetical protein